MEEAKETLNELRLRNYGDNDIAARTELSYARQALSTVRALLFGQGELEGMNDRLLAAERKIIHLLQYIDAALTNIRIVRVPLYS